jgi:hypothetical protein
MIYVCQSDLVRQIAQIRLRSLGFGLILTGSLWGIFMLDASGLANTSIGVRPPGRSPSQQATPRSDTIIIPGKRVGAITSKTTYADLVKLFGSKRLTAKKVYGAEGQVEFPGTEISFGKNRLLTVAWKNTQRIQPLEVIINDPTWQTAEGIGVGTSLDRLRQVLGDFKITGLGWDYGNQVTQIPAALRSRYAGLSIFVDADYLAAQRFSADFKAVSGNILLPASDRHWKPLKIRVSTLKVYFSETSSPKSGK